MTFGLKLPVKSTFTVMIAGIFAAAFLRIHVRVQTTLVGYDIGHLKTLESRLLEERSELRMELAKLTTKQNLTMMVGKDNTDKHVATR